MYCGALLWLPLLLLLHPWELFGLGRLYLCEVMSWFGVRVKFVITYRDQLSSDDLLVQQ